MILIFSVWARTGLSSGVPTIFWDEGNGKICKLLSSAVQVNTLPRDTPTPTLPCLPMAFSALHWVHKGTEGFAQVPVLSAIHGAAPAETG